jgi:hypothetical protein
LKGAVQSNFWGHLFSQEQILVQLLKALCGYGIIQTHLPPCHLTESSSRKLQIGFLKGKKRLTWNRRCFLGPGVCSRESQRKQD